MLKDFAIMHKRGILSIGEFCTKITGDGNKRKRGTENRYIRPDHTTAGADIVTIM